MLSFRHRGAVRIALLAAVAATVLAVSGCASGSTSSDSSAGSWSFKDDLGKTVKLDSTPTRIAGLNDVLVSLMNYGIKPVASFGYSSLQDDQRFTGLDTSGITQVGTSYGEINLEKLAAAKPDLIVADVYPIDEKGTIDKRQPDYGFKNLEQQKQVAQIAPIVTLYMGGDGADVVTRTTQLAKSLGAKSSLITTTRAKYETAKSRLASAAKQHDVQVTVMYADADGVYVAKPEDDPAIRMYRDIGVNTTVPTPKGYYWGVYSWENATKVQGDVILLQQSGYDVAELRKQPTFADNPALAANQVHTWVSSGMDYVSQAAYMTNLAGWLTESKRVTG